MLRLSAQCSLSARKAACRDCEHVQRADNIVSHHGELNFANANSMAGQHLVNTGWDHYHVQFHSFANQPVRKLQTLA